MVWSGVTKCLVSMVQQQRKAIDIPGFGIFGPLLDQAGNLRDPLDKGVPDKRKEPTAGKAHYGGLISPVLVVINDDLLELMEGLV